MEKFIHQPMFTYLGNKRKLLDGITDMVNNVKNKLGKDKLKIMDGFTGSTVVARSLLEHSEELHTNDIELYSYIASNCFLNKPSLEQQCAIKSHIDVMNSMNEFSSGIVTEMYAPADSSNVQYGERCFFTHENALRIDTWRAYIDTIEPELKDWCLGPLLVTMAIRCNGLGHFRAFIKDKNDIGSFSAGKRVTDPLVLTVPIWHDSDAVVKNHNMSTNDLVRSMPDDSLDLIYFDPPYNQHEYGSFYFLLNIVAKNDKPENINKVTGLPKKRTKSEYNSKMKVLRAFEDLLKESTRVAKYVLISYSDDGFIKEDVWNKILENYTSEKHVKTYKRYTGRGKTTGQGRKDVQEILYLISK
jgi:adenine-specific DNA-methyltransferase